MLYFLASPGRTERRLSNQADWQRRSECRWRQTRLDQRDLPALRSVADEALAAFGRLEAIEKSPLGIPWLAPEAIAPAVVLLASDEAFMGATYDATAGDSANITA